VSISPFSGPSTGTLDLSTARTENDPRFARRAWVNDCAQFGGDNLSWKTRQRSKASFHEFCWGEKQIYHTDGDLWNIQHWLVDALRLSTLRLLA